MCRRRFGGRVGLGVCGISFDGGLDGWGEEIGAGKSEDEFTPASFGCLRVWKIMEMTR